MLCPGGTQVSGEGGFLETQVTPLNSLVKVPTASAEALNVVPEMQEAAAFPSVPHAVSPCPSNEAGETLSAVCSVWYRPVAVTKVTPGFYVAFLSSLLPVLQQEFTIPILEI